MALTKTINNIMGEKLSYFKWILFLFVFLLITAVCYASEKNIDVRKAANIACDKAEKSGYDLHEMSMNAMRFNYPRTDCMITSLKAENISKQKHLVGKTYWAVYFARIPEHKGQNIEGGGVCYFIDAVSGEILEVIPGY